MNRNALLEILESTLASDSQREAAQAALYLLDNPGRVTPVELVEPPADPGTLPRYPWLAALADSTISDEGTPARKAWIVGADLWLKSVLENPNFSAELKTEAQSRYDTYTKPEAQYFAEQAAITAAWLADRDDRYDAIRLANPSWDEIQVHNFDVDQQNGRIAPVVTTAPTVPSEREASGPSASKSDIDQLIEHERRLLDQQDAAASRRWNRAMGLSPSFQPGGFKGDD